jgi:hypothetical protein
MGEAGAQRGAEGAEQQANGCGDDRNERRQHECAQSVPAARGGGLSGSGSNVGMPRASTPTGSSKSLPSAHRHGDPHSDIAHHEAEQRQGRPPLHQYACPEGHETRGRTFPEDDQQQDTGIPREDPDPVDKRGL